MKPNFLNRGKLLIGFAVMLFCGTIYAQSDPLEPTWVRPDTDFSVYNKFQVKPLDVSDVRLLRPPWAMDDPKDWSIEDEDLQLIQDIFRDVMKNILEADDGYPVVHVAGEDVLQVEVELLSIMPYIRPGKRETSQGQQYITLGSGEVNARIDLRNSQTRELLLLLEGEKTVGEEYKEHTDANIVANLEGMFSRFATRLRKAMDRVHGE
jgi:hypothetical protein